MNTQRLAQAVSIAALLAALLLRWLAGNKVWHGRTGSHWAILLTLSVSIAALGFTLLAIVRRKIPWPRLLLPLVICVELVRIAAGQSSRIQLAILVAAMDLTLVIVAVYWVIRERQGFRSGAYLEESLEKILAQFMGERLAAISARELVLLWSGIAWASRGFRLKAPPGFSYVEESLIKYLPVLVPMLVAAEGIVYEVLLHHRSIVRLIMHVAEVWAILWCFGMYAIMKSRPHQLTAESVRLRCGFASCEFAPELLHDLRPRPQFDDAPRPRNMARLSPRGTVTMELRLKNPVIVRDMFGRSRWFDLLEVAADHPTDFQRELLALARRS